MTNPDFTRSVWTSLARGGSAAARKPRSGNRAARSWQALRSWRPFRTTAR